MCEKCLEIDGKIAHYREAAATGQDRLTILSVEELVKDLEAQKRALHPDETPDTG